MKTPYEKAREVYEREPCKRSFEEDMRLHMLGGFVFSRPDLFIMGRPVVSLAEAGRIVDPAYHFEWGLCDCWHVHLCAGNIVRAFALMPWPLPLVSFERKNDLRFYAMASIERLSGAIAELNQ